MEKQDYKAVKFHNVPVDNLLDSRKYCDARKVLENEDNFIFEVNNEAPGKKIEEPDEQNGSDDSDEKSVVLEKNERKVLRKCNIWRRQNIDDIEKAVAKRKFQDQMIIQQPVIEKIEKSEFELGNTIEELNNFIKGKCLTFHTNEYEREWIDKNVDQDRLSKIRNTLNEINKTFMDIDDEWEKTSNKEDALVIQEDIISLTKKTLDLLKQKDNIINNLLEGLEELLTKSFNETFSNTNDLDKLNEIVKNKINILKEEHKKYNYTITKLIEDSKNEKDLKDSTQWTLLMDKIINKISSATIKRLALIDKNNIEFLNLYKTNEEEQKNFRLETTENYIGVDTDLEFVKIKCLRNIEKLKYNCSILKKRIEESHFRIVDEKRNINLLQGTKRKLKEKCKKIECDHKTQILSIKKQIVNINQKIDQQEKRADCIAKQDNEEYIQLWDLQLKYIMRDINNIRQIDYFIRDYLSFCGKTYLCEQLTIDDDDENHKTIMPIFKHISNLISYEHPHTKLNDIYYEHRDKALNNLLLDFIVKNSSFVFDQNLNRIIGSNSMQNLSYAYNALSDLKLNKEESWNLIKSKFKPFVMCTVCNSKINWELGEIIGKLDSEQNASSNLISDNNCIDEFKSSKYLYFEKLCTITTEHNKNVGKLTKTDSLHQMTDDSAYSNNITLYNTNEEQNKKYYTSLVNDNKLHDHTLCENMNHELNINNRHFIRVMKEIIKESQSTRLSKPKSLHQRLRKEYNFIQWKISENDLQAYWSQLVKGIPNIFDSWNSYYVELGHYYRSLVVRKKKMTMTKTLENENMKLKKVLQEIEDNLL